MTWCRDSPVNHTDWAWCMEEAKGGTPVVAGYCSNALGLIELCEKVMVGSHHETTARNVEAKGVLMMLLGMVTMR
jgi:hypothetical protein